MSALLAYQFDEEPVRIIVRDGEPWFVASDIAQALGYRDAPTMARNLDEDEKGTHNVCTLGGEQQMLIVSESGMYAAVLKSRRDEARRFRKWVTAEVLPALRRTGRYQLTELEPAPPQATDLDPPRMLAGVSVVREARRLYGPAAARSLWAQVGLPPVIADSEAVFDTDPLAAPLQAALQGKMQITIAEAADAMGIRDLDWTTRHRIGRLLHLWGWSAKNEKVAKHRTARVFRRPESREGLA
ncbi:BRO family protein [Novosphingobium decolorationis]|uniref:Bro-N domain-containing protein n=1 Tax=Novosphingobium decolorationis TaxID=2698673 RepID=A0ABX8E1G7_9SPHN|nr:BRO family protein [Novosphingobium decolorationis]QVM82967.1 hypothetical protein HT578_03900 [Novosphingobium decolorationis]